MNETIHNLLTRRSIRKYDASKQVKDDDLSQIVEAGRYAATARGAQPWHFTVIQDPEVISWIVKKNAESMAQSDNPRLSARGKDPSFHTFFHAPTLIIISATEERFGVIDAANATQNMAVAAHALGLGSCYIAMFERGFEGEKMAELIERLKVPAGFRPAFSLAIGYADGPAPTPAPRKENVTYIR